MKLTKNIVRRYITGVAPNSNYCEDSIVKAINSLSQVYKVDSIQVLEFIFDNSKEINIHGCNVENFLNNFGNLYYLVKRGGSVNEYWREFID